MKPTGPLSQPAEELAGHNLPEGAAVLNIEAAQPAAPLAFIALRIHTALTAPCPWKYSWVVAVNVCISFISSS